MLLEVRPEREAVTLTVVVPGFFARIFSWKPSAVTSATLVLELDTLIQLVLDGMREQAHALGLDGGQEGLI